MIERTVTLKLTCEDCLATLTISKRSNREAARAARSRHWRVKGERALCPIHKDVARAHLEREHSRGPAL